MIAAIRRLTDSTTSVYASCAISFIAGLFFIFVWTPLPFGWQGIDSYYEIAKDLAQGKPYEPFERVWGYPYFLAFWYWIAGDVVWVPLVAQAAVNATVPFMIYRLVTLELGHRYGVMAAILTGLFSFNTVYASTQASDTVCTVLFVATMWSLAKGRASHSPLLFAVSGLLASLTFQFRPNFVLFPVFVAAVYLWVQPRRAGKLAHMAVFLAAFAVVASPWIIRNYRLTNQFIPASTHGGIQLWFGSLQTGPYQSNWLYNPRAAFEHPPQDYSSIDELPVVVSGQCHCGAPADTRVEVIYWTDRNPAVRRVTAPLDPGGRFEVALPDVSFGSEMSYYVEATVRRDGGEVRHVAPLAGARDPGIFVLSRDHLGDLDAGNLVLDVFDVARIAAWVSWGDGTPDLSVVDVNHDGAVTDADLTLATDLLAGALRTSGDAPPVVEAITRDASRTTLVMTDGSTLGIPRGFANRITDLELQGPIAQSLVSRSQTLASVRDSSLPRRMFVGDISDGCLERVGVNSVGYRRYPHEMRRFVALSRDNIARDPVGYAWSTVVRAGRLFVIQGSDDRRTAIQFENSRTIYLVGQSITFAYALLFVAGVIVAIRRRQVRVLLALPIVYVPATISFMLINARYAMTMQPFMFAFIAILLVAWLDRWSPPSRAPVRERQSEESE
ncbi:MAG: glycosyltransferase family 39 protein [Acidobacteriota bacterium]|nr:glycosyltransferase family 39 protein [Acidobacteriota bacterium]